MRWPLLVIAAWIAVAATLFLTLPPLPVAASKHAEKPLPDDAPTMITNQEITEAFAPKDAAKEKDSKKADNPLTGGGGPCW